jgi:hypothetical protein
MKKGKSYSKVDYKKLIERLERNPARPKELEDEFGYPHNTVMHSLKHSKFAESGIIIQLPDGRYTTKSAIKKFTSEEEQIKASYELLKRKLLRPPTPEEISGYIKLTPDEAKPILFKYIPGYREPSQEEIARSANDLWKLLVYSCLDLPGKKAWFDKGIIKIVFEGIDQLTFNEFLENSYSISLEVAREYLDANPDMKPKIIFKEEAGEILYKVEWSEDVKRFLYMIDSWKQTSKIHLPRRFGKNEWSLRGPDYWEALDIAKTQSEIYTLEPEMIDDLLRLIGLKHYELDILVTLRNFCKNSLEVDQLDDSVKTKIVLTLFDRAFVTDVYDKKRDVEKGRGGIEERNKAFEIIELLDVRSNDVIEAVKKYLDKMLILDMEIEGPDIYKVIEWLAKDPALKEGLIEKIDKLLKSSEISGQAGFYQGLLKSII